MTIILPLPLFLVALQSIADFLRNGFAPHNPILLSLVKIKLDPAENSATFSATDAKIFCSFSITLPENSLKELEKTGVFTIEYDTVIKFLKLLKSEEFTFSFDDRFSGVTFLSKRNALNMPTFDAPMHPMPEIKGATRLFVQRGPFLESVDACLSVLSTSDISFNSAVRFCHEQGQPWFYGGDRHRAVVVQPVMDCSTLPEFGVTMPAAFIASVASILADFPTDFIEVQFSDSALQVGAANDTSLVAIYTPLRQGELPDVRSAFLNAAEVVFQSTFPSAELSQAVESVMLGGKNEVLAYGGRDLQYYKIRIESLQDESSLKFSCPGDKSSSAIIDCGQDTFGECAIFINGEYLRSAVKRVKLFSKEVKMATLSFRGLGVYGVVFSDPADTLRIVIALLVQSGV